MTTASTGRVVPIAGAIALGVGLMGFLVGIAQPVVPRRTAALAETPRPTAAVPAPAYGELNAATVGPNRSWSSDFAALKQTRPGLLDAVPRTPALKDAALIDRRRTRAFEGAPPVIPHAVEQQSAASCLVCHAEGTWFGDRLATRISHPHFSSCTQCHVASAGGVPVAAAPIAPAAAATTIAAAPVSAVSDFVGLARSGPGTRAMPGAPPTIPHSTHLRDDCLSCHGLVARPGLRTTHPWLQNCRQCHAAAAELDSLADEP